jgi:CheY-like chemotaxis protein
LARADNSLAQHNKTLARSLIYKPGQSVASSTGRKIQPKQYDATRPRRGAAFILGPNAMAISLAGISMARLRRVVAVVDDDPGMLKAMRQLLQMLDYDTELYSSAETFISSAAESDAICLLVDVELGGMSGIELKRRLAASGIATPVIFMTGSDSKVIRKQAHEAGCVGFLRKPFSASLLMDAIGKALN